MSLKPVGGDRGAGTVREPAVGDRVLAAGEPPRVATAGDRAPSSGDERTGGVRVPLDSCTNFPVNEDELETTAAGGLTIL